MKFKGRRQSTNIEDVRGSRGRSIGIKGGIIGTLAIAIIAALLNVDPGKLAEVVGMGEQQEVSNDTQLTAQEKEMTEFVGVVLADTEDVWNKLFREYGSTYREPKLVLFSSAVSSACGYAQSATGPFYCPGDEKVYLDLDYLQILQQKLGANGDFAVAYIIAHEVGHHVQNLMGTMDDMSRYRAAARSEEEVNGLTIRLELQADFLAGVWINHAQKMKDMMEQGDLEEALNAASSVGDDRIQMKTQGYVVPDAFTHGTSEQRKNWLRKGIVTGDLRQGDTFNRNTVL
jgi:hypothetical protein